MIYHPVNVIVQFSNHAVGPHNIPEWFQNTIFQYCIHVFLHVHISYIVRGYIKFTTRNVHWIKTIRQMRTCSIYIKYTLKCIKMCILLKNHALKSFGLWWNGQNNILHKGVFFRKVRNWHKFHIRYIYLTVTNLMKKHTF